MQTHPRIDISPRLRTVLASKVPWRIEAWEECRPSEKVYRASIENCARIAPAFQLERATFKELCVTLVYRRFAAFRPHYADWMPAPLFQLDQQRASV